MTRLTFANIRPTRVFDSSGYALYYTAGNVGVGKNNPTVPLDVSGNVTISGNVNIDSGLLYVDGLNNRVGVGKANPSITLDVSGSIAATTVTATTLTGTLSTAAQPNVTSIGTQSAFAVSGTSQLTGSVGIGKTDPSTNYILDVSGNVYSMSTNVNIVQTPYNHTWTSTGSSTISYTAVCWSKDLNLFVATNNSVTGGRIATSPTGLTWTTRTTPADNNWQAICYGYNNAGSANTGAGTFVATSSDGTNRVMTSYDGITWTARSVVAANWRGVCWSEDLGLFCAVAIGGNIMTSPDGITWTTRTAPVANNWIGVCWGSGRFVAVGNSGTGNRVMTSTDGVTWTSRTSAADINWCSVTFAPALALYVAVSYGGIGTGNRVMTSPNGTTWTTRSCPDNDWSSIVWSPEIGLFVVVSSNGVSNGIMTSPDGINWTTRTSPTNSFQSACWSPQLNRFLAVSNTGSTRVAYSNDSQLSVSIGNTNRNSATLTVNGDLIVNDRVGIGITNPSYPVQVVGYINRYFGTTNGSNAYMGYTYTNADASSVPSAEALGTYYNANTALTIFNTSLSLVTNNSIWCSSLAMSSDSRIKNNIQDLNDPQCLSMINAIEPKTYNYIDKMNRGSNTVYGFIAQQIKEVLPQAVSLQKEYIPSIYCFGTHSNSQIKLFDPSGEKNLFQLLSVDDKVKLYNPDNSEVIVTVVSIDSESMFTINRELPNQHYFVYGKEVNDFHTLNKDYIFTINVCATQELSRKVVDLESRIAELEKKLQQSS